MKADIDKKMLKEIKEYLKKLNKNLEIVTFELHQNIFTHNTIDLLEGLVYCLKGLHLTRDSHDIELEEDLFREKIEELKQALKSKEYYMAGDIMEYEVSELIFSLRENLKNV